MLSELDGEKLPSWKNQEKEDFIKVIPELKIGREMSGEIQEEGRNAGR